MMEHHVWIFLSMGILLGTARLLGELTKQMGLTSLLGEIGAGILLGPTVLGAMQPDVFASLFPSSGAGADVLSALTAVSIAMFLLVSGMEVDLSTVWRQGRRALIVSATGVILPFTVGAGVAALFPSFLGMGTVDNPLVFPLFWGTALSISALPVIARVLMELNLFRTDMGMIVMPAAVLQDVLGWCVFAVVLSMMGINQTFSIGETIAYTLAFSAFAIVVLRRVFDRVIPWISAHWDSPGAIIGIGVAVALIAAAFTEWIGIHGLFGAFFVGIALGDSRHLNERTRFAFHQFISYFFAPLFFASIGLQVDFGRHFDIVLVLIVLGIATFGKLAGSLVGCRLAGISRRDAVAIGFAMNARGAMEIILGLVALQYGILSEKPFVALVVMALFTSLASGPIIKRVLRLKRLPILTDFMSGRTFLRFDEPTMPRAEIIRRMVEAIGTTPRTRIDVDTVARLVLDREELMHTGIGDGIAIPHARIPGIDNPRIAIGITRDGVDFDAPDGKPARIVILLLTPEQDTNLPLEIFAEIARTFSSDDTRLRVFQAMNFTELKAVIKHAAGAARRQKGLKWPL